MLFVTATGTEIGKTFCASKILDYFLIHSILDISELAYYKPIQSGEDDFDTKRIQNLFPSLAIYNTYSLKYPCSPDLAAYIDNQNIDIDQILDDYEQIKSKHKFILLEGAGGLAVPIGKNFLMIDLIKKLSLPIILVISQKLGTINHSILSIKFAKDYNLDILGITSMGLSDSFDQFLFDFSLQSIIDFTGVNIFDLDAYVHEHYPKFSDKL